MAKLSFGVCRHIVSDTFEERKYRILSTTPPVVPAVENPVRPPVKIQFGRTTNEEKERSKALRTARLW